MDLKGVKTLVFGAGKSGIASAGLLLKCGADVILFDGNDKLDKEALRAKVAENAGELAEKLAVITGELTDEAMAGLKTAVLSPGVPCDIEEVARLIAAGAEIIGEVELAYRAGAGRVLAVTGTNGKTTTTTLLGELMKTVCGDVRVVGNIGNPYTDAALQLTEDSVTVAEISSFQLETCDTFHPMVSVITNITQDHLNRHHTMEEYIRVKESITKNQTPDDLCVLNYEDEVLREFGKTVNTQVQYFSSQRVLERGWYVSDGAIYRNLGGGPEKIIDIDDLQLVGDHNMENICCAAAAAAFAGADIEDIRKTLKAFKGVEHRIEFVCEKNGVRYYNDSKGTNPDAAIKGIDAMKWPTLLIGGGYDKGSTYESWIEHFGDKVKYFTLIGQTKEKIRDAALRCGFPKEHIIMCEDLKEATDFCMAHAEPGDAVLLSPACASWGQFDNYEQRGDMFKEYVRG